MGSNVLCLMKKIRRLLGHYAKAMRLDILLDVKRLSVVLALFDQIFVSELAL